MTKIVRKKAFIGAAIGAVAGIAGGILNGVKQRKAQKLQQKQQTESEGYQQAQAMSQQLANQDYVDQYKNKITLKMGGHCRKKSELGSLGDNIGSASGGIGGLVGGLMGGSKPIKKSVGFTYGDPKTSLVQNSYTLQNENEIPQAKFGANKNTYTPDVVRGGIAIPLGNNYYYMKGRTHKYGGIDIGKNPKTGLEVEDGEVMKMSKNNVRVFSAVPFLKGESPAQKIIKGENPSKVFNQQERFKYVNNLNDDGTKKALGGDGFWDNLFNKIKGYFSSDDNKNSNSDVDIMKNGRDFLKTRQNVMVDSERKLPNDSPTKNESEAIERDLRYTAKRNQLVRPESKVYDIPYIYDKEIKVNGAGRVSGNVLDSIAVNLNKANKILKSKGLKPVSLSDAIGLPVHETKMGAMPAYITNYRHKVNKPNALYNTSTFRNYGNIPAAALVMNHEYYNKGYKDSKYDYITNIESPLAQAYVLYGNGLYNTGDKSHTQKVKSAGQKAMLSRDVINWMNNLNNDKNRKKYDIGGEKNTQYLYSELNRKTPNNYNNSSNNKEPINRGLNFISPVNNILDKSPNIQRINTTHRETLTPKQQRFRNRMQRKAQRIAENQFTTNDKIGLASNIIGAGISNIINNNTLNKMRYSSQPVGRSAVKLNTSYNINPQLDSIRESTALNDRLIANNTASSRVSLARQQSNRNNSLNLRNNLYGQKTNIENQLVNQDRMNRQSVEHANIGEYNNWRNGLVNFNNIIAEKKSENNVGTIQNMNSAVQDMITRNEQRRNENQTIAAMTFANPNLPIDMLYQQGLISENVYNAYNKAYRNKRVNG